MRESETVLRELSKNDVERLFLSAVDGALAEDETAIWAAQLEADPKLKARFSQYMRTVRLLGKEPREKAPDALASLILRRTRRRRIHNRNREQIYSLFPAEVVVPMVIVALVALFMLIASQ